MSRQPDCYRSEVAVCCCIAGVGDALLQVAGLEPSDEYIDF